jgi:hypothetical protein
MAMDQSVRGFAWASASTGWAGDWSKLFMARYDGGSISRAGSEALHKARQVRLLGDVSEALTLQQPSVVGFESYAFSARPDVDVVELVGMIKSRCWMRNIVTTTINQSTARKFLLGKVPRKGEEAKRAVQAALLAAGMPPSFATLDHSDALCILNYMLSLHGAYCFAQNQA